MVIVTELVEETELDDEKLVEELVEETEVWEKADCPSMFLRYGHSHGPIMVVTTRDPSKEPHSIVAKVYPSVKYGLSFPTASFVVSQPPEPEIGVRVQLTPARFAQVKVWLAAFHVISTKSQLVSLS